MKMQPEHYALLLRECRNIITARPDAEIGALLEGHSPKRFRWDLLWATKIQIGSVTTPPSEGREDKYLPLYDYLHDDHIDTALRKVCSELGLDYGAAKDSEQAPGLKEAALNTLSPGGQFFGTFRGTRADGSTFEQECLVNPDTGAVSLSNAARSALSSGSFDQSAVLDRIGYSYDLESDGHIQEVESFVARSSVYTVHLHEQSFIRDEDGQATLTDSREISIDMKVDIESIAFDLRNFGIDTYSGTHLTSSEPAATDDFFRKGIEKYRTMVFTEINGKPAEPEAVLLAARMLGIAVPEPTVKQTSGMRLG